MNEIDKLSLYFGDDFIINDFITVHNPTIGDVIKVGEAEYYRALHLLTAIPSDMKAFLWDMDICWMDISDFDFFRLISRGLTPEITEVFLGDLNLSEMECGRNPMNGDPVLYRMLDDGNILIIDEYIYYLIVTILRTIHNLTPKIERVRTKTLTKLLVQINREDIAKANSKPFTSVLFPLISAMVNVEGFKYNLKQIREMPYFAFMDSVQRISLIKSTTALLNGCYSGWIDGNKIDKKELNWLKEMEINTDIKSETNTNTSK